MEEYILSCFETQKVLKKENGTQICRLISKNSANLYILKRVEGNVSAFSTYQALLGCRCQNLPVIYEAALRDESYLVLEEYLPGDSLDDLLQAGTLTSVQTKEIVLQLCDALYVLHSLGKVHRDVKPENVIMTGNRAVLIDFGAAREMGEERAKDTQILGTVGYAAPEQYGFSQTDARTDIYALGILINELLTLEHPSVKLAPGKWGNIIGKCTMVSPEKRYQTIPELANEVRALS